MTGILGITNRPGMVIADIINIKNHNNEEDFVCNYLLLVASSASYATGIEETWKAKMQGPNGDMELTFVFKMTDGKLSGVVRTP